MTRRFLSRLQSGGKQDNRKGESVVQDEAIELLVALRALQIQTYIRAVRALPGIDPEDVMARVTDRAREAYGEDDSEVDLRPLIPSDAYAQLIAGIDASDPELAELVATLLSRRLDEQSLAARRESDYPAFLESLPVLAQEDVARGIVTGTIVNLLDEAGEPEPIRTDEEYSGAFTHRPSPTARIEATDLVEVLSRFASGDLKDKAGPKGLRVHQVLITGTLDLNWLECSLPIGFEGCSFTESVSADHAHLRWLSFDTCDFNVMSGYRAGGAGSFDAIRLVVDEELRFFDCTGVGQLFLVDSDIASFVPGRFQDQEEAGDNSEGIQDIRAVFNGTSFGKLAITDDARNILGFVSLPRSVQISGLDVAEPKDAGEAAEELLRWLAGPNKKKPIGSHVADQFEGALRASGQSEMADEFGIRAEERNTYADRVGILKRLFIGRTVKYFYRNTNALKVLVGLWLAAWILSFSLAQWAPSQLTPADSAELPHAWFGSLGDKGVWSFLYSTDLVFSPLSLGLAQVPWPSSSWISLVFAVIKAVSLFFMGLFVTGISGLTDRGSKK